MISKSFDLQSVKKTKGKIDVKFSEIQDVSAYIKEETKNLLNGILECKIAGVVEQDDDDNVESLSGGSNE